MSKSGKHLFIVLSFLFAGSVLFAQTPKQWERYGDKSFEDADYYGAAIYYKKALNAGDTANTPLTFKYAQALRSYNEYEKAEKYYQEVVDKDPDLHFDEAIYWLAEMQKYNGKYDEAKKNFRKFTKKAKDRSGYYARKSKQEIKSCEYAKKLILDTIDVKVENAGNELNSYASEFSPVFLNDSTIYFTTMRSEEIKENGEVKDEEYLIRIHQAVKEDSIWKGKGELTTGVNIPEFHSANGAFSKDGKYFYFSRCDMNRKCEIWVAEQSNGKWATAEKMEGDVNVEGYTSTQPFVADADGNEDVLFFVSDRPRGKGKLDIWYTYRDRRGKMRRPKNVGRNINTKGNDISPFYDSKNNTLYFSSDWHYGLGGFDVQKSTTTSTLRGLSKPDNLGVPFNSSVNDMYYTMDSTRKKGFLTSNRKGSYTLKGETCCNDLYYFEYPKEVIPIPPEVAVNKLNNYLPVLYFHNDEPNPRTKDTTTNLNYMKTYEDYRALTEKYQEEYSKGLEGDKVQEAKDDIEAFFEDKVDQGVDDLELFSELLLKELEKGRKIEMAVKGYASPLAKTDYNVNLTLRRISSMENYLREYDSDTIKGAYLPYLNGTAENGGRLEIIKIPFGEYRADQTVSDNLNDQKNSIYSRNAALERKIEVVKVELAGSDSAVAEIAFAEEVIDLGAIKQGDEKTVVFKFKNKGKVDLEIQSLVASCECTVAKFTEDLVPPKGSGEIEVTYNSTGQMGKVARDIVVLTNGTPKEKTLTITTEVLP